MTDASSRIAGRNRDLEKVALRVSANNVDGLITAIELCGEDNAERESDRELVRKALRDGALPGELGTVFVSVVADLTYDVDWRDQFRYWPIVAQAMSVPAFDLENDISLRRQTAEAFDAFAARFGGVSPIGAFALRFPFMSRPLVHSMLPACAQRHVARLFERASTQGRLPADESAPWPVDDLVDLGESLSLPVYVRGLLENRAIIEPAGRALLGLVGADPAAWVQRLSRSVREDKVTNDLLQRARERSKNARKRVRKESAPQIGLAFTDDDPPSLWVEVAAIGDVQIPKADIAAFARGGAELRLVSNKTTILKTELVELVSAPLASCLELVERPSVLSLQVRPYADEVPTEIAAYFNRARRELKVPVALTDSGAGRYVEAPVPVSIEEGDRIAVVADSRHAPALRSAKLTESVLGQTGLSAFTGVATDSNRSALQMVGITVDEAKAHFLPVLTPAVRQQEETLTYARGTEVWLRIESSSPSEELTVELVPAEAGRLSCYELDNGARVVNVRAKQNVELRLLRTGVSRPLARIAIEFEDHKQSVLATRWRASLQPADATTKHLTERLCWIQVDALSGVRLNFDLRCMRGEEELKSALAARTPDIATPLASMKFLDRLLEEAGVKAGDAISTASLRVWSDDEPDLRRELGAFQQNDSALRFELTKAEPKLRCESGGVKIERLDFAPTDYMRAEVTDASLRTPGIFVASIEGAITALCVAESGNRIPRLRSPGAVARGRAKSQEVVSLLRALDVADIWPVHAYAQGLFIRRNAVRSLERAMVGSLCGAEWLLVEDEIVASSLEQGQGLQQLAYLTWLDHGVLEELLEHATEVEDPFALLSTALSSLKPTTLEYEAARHLLLLFYRRGLASPVADEAALSCAWKNRQLARVVRFAYLALPDAFEMWRSREVDGDE